MTKLDIYSSKILIRQKNDVWVNICIDNPNLSYEEMVQISRTYLREQLIFDFIKKRRLPTPIVNYLSFWGKQNIFDSLLKYQDLEVYAISQIYHYGTYNQRELLREKYKYKLPRE